MKIFNNDNYYSDPDKDRHFQLGNDTRYLGFYSVSPDMITSVRCSPNLIKYIKDNTYAFLIATTETTEYLLSSFLNIVDNTSCCVIL